MFWFKTGRRLFIWGTIVILILILAYLLTKSYQIKVVKTGPQGGTLLIKSLLPIKIDSLKKNLLLIPEIPGTPVFTKVLKTHDNNILLYFQLGDIPHGQKIDFKAKTATVFPLLNYNLKGHISLTARPKLKKMPDSLVVPTRGPIPLSFDTIIDPNSIAQGIATPVPGRWIPQRVKGSMKIYTNYSRWFFYPDQPLPSGQKVSFNLKPSLSGRGNNFFNNKLHISFETAKMPALLKSNPDNNANNSSLYPELIFNLSEEVKKATIEGIGQGNTIIVDNKVTFRPEKVFLPGKTFSYTLKVITTAGEPGGPWRLSFSTRKMTNELWVDINLNGLQTMTIYKGLKPIRKMLVSGGRPGFETPLGILYIGDRGLNFFSARYSEGAKYWVRLRGNYLVHSVPRDANWQLKEDEHAKLGLAASHGCIRLDDPNAKWFYDNIPSGTMVVIHDAKGISPF